MFVTTTCRNCKHTVEVPVETFNYRQSATCRDGGRECPMVEKPRRRKRKRRQKAAHGQVVIFHQGSIEIPPGVGGPGGLADQVAAELAMRRRTRAY